MNEKGVEVNDVIQIDPTTENGMFNGCYLRVTEVRVWGVIAEYLKVEARGEIHSAFGRFSWSEFERVGASVWVPQSEG